MLYPLKNMNLKHITNKDFFMSTPHCLNLIQLQNISAAGVTQV